MKYLEHNGHSNKKRYKLCMLLIMCITMTYIAAGCGSKRDGLTITNVLMTLQESSMRNITKSLPITIWLNTESR